MKKFLKVMVWINAIFECVMGLASIIVTTTIWESKSTLETMQRIISFIFGLFLLLLGGALLYVAIKDFNFPQPKPKKVEPPKQLPPAK